MQDVRAVLLLACARGAHYRVAVQDSADGRDWQVVREAVAGGAGQHLIPLPPGEGGRRRRLVVALAGVAP